MTQGEKHLLMYAVGGVAGMHLAMLIIAILDFFF